MRLWRRGGSCRAWRGNWLETMQCMAEEERGQASDVEQGVGQGHDEKWWA